MRIEPHAFLDEINPPHRAAGHYQNATHLEIVYRIVRLQGDCASFFPYPFSL
jgi:hypothetical protein